MVAGSKRRKEDSYDSDVSGKGEMGIRKTSLFAPTNQDSCHERCTSKPLKSYPLKIIPSAFSTR